jgi:predicted nucleotidyltransferase/DNA-binding XRE family transcriptional regulator
MKISTLLARARAASGLTQAELAERASTSQPAVNRYERGTALPSLPTLERLVRATGRSLVVETRPGLRPGLVSARSGSGRVAQALRAQRSRVLALADEHGARNVRVFGSVARGDEHGGSDVDLLVDLTPGRTLLDLVGLRLALQDLLHLEVDVTTLDMLKPSAREAAGGEAVPL